MEDTITTIYCLCDEFLKAMGHRDDPQARMSTAEVMTVPLVAATFFGGDLDETRSFLDEYGYMPEMISKAIQTDLVLLMSTTSTTGWVRVGLLALPNPSCPLSR